MVLGALGIPAAVVVPFFVSLFAVGLASMAWLDLRSDTALRGRRLALVAAVLGGIGVVLSLLAGLSFFAGLA